MAIPLRHHTQSGTARGIAPAQHISRPRSLVSIASSTSASEASRRRSAVLEMDSPFRNSLQRAQDVLRASERGRNEDERRTRSRSTTFAEPPLEARRRSPPSAERSRHHATTHDQGDGNRSGQKLHESRSIPLNLLTSPTPKLGRASTTSHDFTHISPPFNSSRPRRVVSHGNLLSSPERAPVSILQTSPKYLASRPAPQPSRLPVPEEPTSKFSCSSGESKLDSLNWTASIRSRARTMSSFALKKTPSRLTLNKKSSLATLFDDVLSTASTSQRHSDDQTIAADVKNRTTSGQRQSSSSQEHLAPRYSTSSSAPPIDSPSLESDLPRRGFFRGALRDLTRGASLRHSGSSHARSASNSSVSVTDSASKRASDVSSRDGSEKKGGWIGRLGKRVGGKVAARVELFESAMESPSPVVHLAEKVDVRTSGKSLLCPLDTGRPLNSLRRIGPPPISDRPCRAPSRIPISAVFPQVSTREQRRRPIKKESSDDTTFYGHSIPQAALSARRSSLAGKRSSIPLPTGRGTQLQAVLRPSSHRANAPASLVIESELHLAPLQSTYQPAEAPQSPSESSGNEDISSPTSPSPNRRSFRAPSPARFRDVLPSEPAFSSPEKTAKGLPLPGGSPQNATSPKKRAMGPEQIIGMVEDSADEGIVEARGATTDLAALLSDLEETQELKSSAQNLQQSPLRQRKYHFADLSASLRHHLPRVESTESIRSLVSDVPDDLQQLIRSVSDHISEVTTAHSMFDESPFHFDASATTFGDEVSSDEDSVPCFDDEEDRPPFALHRFGANDDHNVYSGEGSGGSTTGPLSTASEGEAEDSTCESFEGHISTAATALTAMLTGADPIETSVGAGAGIDEEIEAVDQQPRLRDSVQEYLNMERPTIGEKMLDEMDFGVPLNSLVPGESPAVSTTDSQPPERDSGHHLRNQSMVSSSEGSSECGMGSPTPASGQALLRHSMVRYSQDRSRHVHRRGPSTHHDSSGDDDPALPEEATSYSASHSSRSTNLSISSLHSSPCPVPRNRRIPMLTRHTPNNPDFHFPPLASNQSTLRGAPLSPWTQTHLSSSPTKRQENSSPFKKLFDPLEEFRARGSTRDSAASEEDSTGEIELQAALAAPSPRFVRSTASPQTRPVPPALPLSAQSLSNVFVPPDTPPPSSPSLYASDSDRSSQFSAFRTTFDLDQHPPLVSARGKTHSRQVSRSSGLIRDTILEDERETLISPVSSPTMQLPLPPPISPIVLSQRPLESIDEPGSPAGAVETTKLLATELYAPIRLAHGPQTFNLTFSSAPAPKDEPKFEEEDDLELPFDELYTLVDEDTTQLIMKGWMHFTYEAEAELRRSMARWPDTEASLAALAHFQHSMSTHDMLQFLFDSQNRFRSLAPLGSYGSLSGYPSPDIYPAHALSPPTPMVSSDGSNAKSDYGPVEISPPSPSPVPVSKAPRRMPLGSKPVNSQLVLTKSTSSPQKEESALSPFTALPPKLGLRSKLRSKLASSSPTKKVDLSFLGSAKPVSQRRKDALDAARRKLEGLSAEQDDGGSGSEDTGVLEAKGEGDSLGFAKTPRVTSNRPRVRRRQGLSMLR